MEENIIKAKVLVVGDHGVGKTAFTDRIQHSTYACVRWHVPEKHIHPLAFLTNRFLFQFDCWELSDEHDEHDERGSHDFMDAQAAIILFDVNSPTSFKNVRQWYHSIVRVCAKITIALCGSKADAKHRRATMKQLALDREVLLPYFEISARFDADEVLYEPFLSIAHELARIDRNGSRLVLMEPFRTCPPDIVMTAEQITELEAQNAAAAFAVPLLHEDDDL